MGTRLAGVLPGQPKAIARIDGRPILEWILRDLRSQGIAAVTLATGYLAESIEQYFAEGRGVGVSLRYSREPRRLGTGGAARLALAQTEGDPLLILNGDTYSSFDVDQLCAYHLRSAARATIAVARVPDAGRFGVTDMNANGDVVTFGARGRAGEGWVSAGACVVDRSVIRALPRGRPVSMEHELFPALVGAGLRAVKIDGPFVDIGTPASLEGASLVIARILADRNLELRD